MKRLPLRHLVPLIILAAGLLGVVILTAVEIGRVDAQAEEQARERAQLLGTLLSAEIEAAFRRDTPNAARRMLDHLGNDRELTAAAILDEDNSILAAVPAGETQAEAVTRLIEREGSTILGARESLTARAQATGDSLVSAFPVLLGRAPDQLVPTRTGVLLLQHDLSGFKHTAMIHALASAAAIAATFGAVSLTLWFLLNRLLLARVQGLVTATRRIADGEYRVARRRIEGGRDELQEVEVALGEMADRLESQTCAIRRSETMKRAVIDSALDAIITFDETGRIVDFNPAAERIYGWRAEEVIGKPFWEVVVPEQYRQLYQEGMAYYARGGESKILDRHHEYLARHADGHLFPVEFTVVRSDSEGRVLFTSFSRDTSERRNIDGRLRLAASALANMTEAVAILDAQRRITSINPAFSRITGYSEEEIQGRTFTMLEQPEADTEVWQQVQATGSWQGVAWSRRSNGDIYPAMYTVDAVRGEDAAAHCVVVFNDLSRHRDLEERLSYLTNNDPLTGLPNRKRFRDHLQEALERAERHESKMGVMLIDLDTFKTINDSLGHRIGDQLLSAVGERLAAQLDGAGRLARLGGDEFAVLLEELDAPDRAAEQADGCLRQFAQPFHCDGYELFTSASIGISLYPNDGRDVDTLIKNADTALYRAKARGRNLYQFFSAEMNAQALDSLMLANSLRQAVNRDELTLDYQPLVDLKSGRLAAVEALVRWRHPERGLIVPSRFIPVAEEHGLIGAIGDWVLVHACRQASAWQRAGRPPIRMAVNLSARQLQDPDLARRISQILRESGLEAKWLELELTETIVMEDPEHARSVLKELKATGVTIAIDDFGTGYSSLSYLKQFPIDYLKIDRSFITGIPGDPDDLAITKTIISMANSLDIQLIAEGVETRQQLDFLKAHGCDEGQGFLLGRPLPAASFAAQ